MGKPSPADHMHAQYAEAWDAAVGLAAALRAGSAFPTQPTALVLSRGEAYHCGVDARMAAYYGKDVSHNSGMFAAGTSWTGLAVTAGLSAAWNANNKRKARREAETQWRDHGPVFLHLTSGRLVVVEDGQLRTFWLDGGVAMFDPRFEQWAMGLQAPDGSPLLFQGPAVPYVAVLLHVILRGQVPPLHSPGQIGGTA